MEITLTFRLDSNLTILTHRALKTRKFISAMHVYLCQLGDMLIGRFHIPDGWMRFRVCAFGMFVKLMTLKQNLHASVRQETAAAAFHFRHCLDRRDVAVEQPGCCFEVRLCQQVEWHW